MLLGCNRVHWWDLSCSKRIWRNREGMVTLPRLGTMLLGKFWLDPSKSKNPFRIKTMRQPPPTSRPFPLFTAWKNHLPTFALEHGSNALLCVCVALAFGMASHGKSIVDQLMMKTFLFNTSITVTRLSSKTLRCCCKSSELPGSHVVTWNLLLQGGRKESNCIMWKQVLDCKLGPICRCDIVINQGFKNIRATNAKQKTCPHIWWFSKICYFRMLSYVPCLIYAALSNASPATQLEGISNKNAALNLHPPFAREFKEASQGDKFWGFLLNTKRLCATNLLVQGKS